MLKRFLTSLVVRDLMLYNNLDHTHRLFGISRGELQSLQMECKVFYHVNLRIIECMHFDLLYEVFKSFERDVIADVPPEAQVFLNEGVGEWGW